MSESIVDIGSERALIVAFFVEKGFIVERSKGKNSDEEFGLTLEETSNFEGRGAFEMKREYVDEIKSLGYEIAQFVNGIHGKCAIRFKQVEEFS